MAYKKKDPRDRIGHSHGAVADEGPITRGRSRRNEIPAIPTASERWLPQARSWYNSLALSGMMELYEASDWATAVCAAQAYDTFLRTRNASILAHFSRLSERLGATLIDRKRAQVELSEPEPADHDNDAADAVVLEWRNRLVPDRKERRNAKGKEQGTRPEQASEAESGGMGEDPEMA